MADPRSAHPAPARRPGLSVRAKLTLSYAAFLLVAWAGFLVALWAVLRFLPDRNLVVAVSGSFVPNRGDLLQVAYPVALVGTLVMMVAGLGGGWLLAGRMLRPLSAIEAAARRAATGSLGHRLALPGPDDELRRLADSFDTMLARLQRSFDEQRRFTSNASHELRTPQATIKTMLEVARADPTGRDVDQVLSRLTEVNEAAIQTTEAMLRLALTDQAVPVRELCQLDLVVRGEVAAYDEELAAADLDVILDLEPVQVLADLQLLRGLVRNLVVNAVRHNVGDRGLVRVATHLDPDGRAVLEVENTGDVLTPEVVATIVEPFARARGRTRAPGDRGGSGLGLAIVASIARHHDAHLDLRARPGGGLIVSVVFSSSEARRAGARGVGPRTGNPEDRTGALTG